MHEQRIGGRLSRTAPEEVVRHGKVREDLGWRLEDQLEKLLELFSEGSIGN